MAENPLFWTLSTFKFASRHNGVHFLDIDLPSNHQRVAQNPQFLTLVTSTCALRHSGVHFFDVDSPSNRQKVLRDPSVFNIFTWKCASRHNGVHFFHISTSKNRPRPTCFDTFDFQMCFAPQRRALFQHLNSKSGPELTCFDTFYFQMCFAPQRRALFRHRMTIESSKSGPNPTCFATFYFQTCFVPQRGALFQHLNFQTWSGADVFWHFLLPNVLRATTACTFSTSQLPKVVREWCVLYTFYFQMCFAPQRRAPFPHLNFQKWSENGVFCHFLLPNVLRATTACTFSTSQLPKVVRAWGVLTLFTSKCASRHNGVQFFISHLASYLRTRRFSEPTFRPSGAEKSLEKHSVSRLSYLFAHLHLLSSDFLHVGASPLRRFLHVFFSSLHIVGSLASKRRLIICLLFFFVCFLFVWFVSFVLLCYALFCFWTVVCLFVCLFVGWLVGWLVACLVWFVCVVVCLVGFVLFGLFVRSSVRMCVCLFVCLFVGFSVFLLVCRFCVYVAVDLYCFFWAPLCWKAVLSMFLRLDIYVRKQSHDASLDNL